AQPPRRFVERTAGRSCSGDVAIAVKRNRANGIVRDGRRKQILALFNSSRLKFTQPLHFARDYQVFVLAERDSVLGGKSFSAFADKIYVRAVTENFAHGANRVRDAFDAASACSEECWAIHA